MDTLDFKVMRGANGAMSFYLNDYRIAGEKPLGGGIVTVLTTVRAKDVLKALELSDLVEALREARTYLHGRRDRDYKDMQMIARIDAALKKATGG
jgi:hypothetical protein